MTITMDRPGTATLDRATTRVRSSDLEMLTGIGAVPPAGPATTVADVKARARAWVRANAPHLHGLVAAHLTGGITSLSDEAPFPAGKDVDLHLVVDPCSPLLTPAPGGFYPILTADLDGVPLEAGVKETADYACPEAVLGNPEIAVHLCTAEGILFDPLGILAGLVPGVAAGYARREWVLARLAHERAGHEASLGMAPWVRARFGALGEASFLGHPVTYLPAALQVASLSPLRIGGRMLVNLRQQLAWLGELELHEEILGALGVRHGTPAEAEGMLGVTLGLVDRAVAVRVGPHPFQHKLTRGQREALADGGRRMIAEGHHREAMAWATPFYASSSDVLLADGPGDARGWVQELRADLLRLLGRGSETAQAARVDAVRRVGEEVFALAGRIAAAHPGIRD